MVKRRTTHPKPSVMIFADASWCQKTKAGGWGVWLKADSLERGVVKGGPIRVDVPAPNIAELVAIANGLYVAKRIGLLTPLAVVMIQSDCIEALGHIRRRIPSTADNRAPLGIPVDLASGNRRTQKRVKPALDTIHEIVIEFQLNLQVRHVRGHQEGDGRAYVNRLCDEIARAGMRQRRAQLAAQKRSEILPIAEGTPP